MLVSLVFSAVYNQANLLLRSRQQDTEHSYKIKQISVNPLPAQSGNQKISFGNLMLINNDIWSSILNVCNISINDSHMVHLTHFHFLLTHQNPSFSTQGLFREDHVSIHLCIQIMVSKLVFNFSILHKKKYINGVRNRISAHNNIFKTTLQQRYSTIERELTAVRWGVKIFRPFLMSVPFEIWTDHKPLMHLQNMAQDRSKFMRILDELAEYDFVIHYHAGSDNSAADAMSRILLGPDNAEDVHLPDHCALPEGFVVQEYVKGGEDYLLTALILCMKRIRKEELTKSMPEDETQLREETVDHVLQHPQKYGLKLTRATRRQWRAMRRPGQLPSEAVLLAIAALYQVEI